jgi:hypothetical protein
MTDPRGVLQDGLAFRRAPLLKSCGAVGGKTTVRDRLLCRNVTNGVKDGANGRRREPAARDLGLIDPARRWADRPAKPVACGLPRA